MITTVLSIKHEPGEFAITNGHKGNERKNYKNGKYINPTGYGWGTEYKPSRIVITVYANSRIVEVWVDQYFKANLGRLTAKRVTAILESAPKEIELVECVSAAGSVYYSATERSLSEWLKRVEEKL